jgi:hypothetical protein
MERGAGDSGTNYRRRVAGRRGRSKLAAAVAAVAAFALALGLAPGASATGGVPTIEEEPAITGTPAVGDALSCSSGKWTGEPTTEPTTFTYKWLRGAAVIQEAAERTEVTNGYTLQAADEGQILTCQVTAENTAGPSQPATSPGVTVPTLPKNTEPPTLTGMVVIPILHLEVALVGHPLSCSEGRWTGSPAPTLTYRWLRDGTPIEGATGSSYTIQTADEGTSLWCEVIATNAAGSTGAASGRAVVPIVRAGGAGGGSQVPTEGQPSGEETPSGGGAISVGNHGAGTNTKTPSDTKISYSVAARSGVIFVKLDCTSATNECPAVTVRLSIVVVEHLRGGHVTAVTATKKGATKRRTVVIGSIAVKLVRGSKTVGVPLNSVGRTLERQRKAFAAQVQLTSGGRVVATEDVQIKQAASQKKKPSTEKTKSPKTGSKKG